MRGRYLKRKWTKQTSEWKEKWKNHWHSFLGRMICHRVKDKSFTIISNNCWAGRVYQFLGLPYNSPTVGLYFFPNDYLKFVGNLRYYLSLELQFIPAEASKYAVELKERNQLDKIIGVLDDVEIVFLHYHSQEEAKEKWKRRAKRVNYDNLLIKFSQMNGCEEWHLREFDKLPHNNKFVFLCKPDANIRCGLYYSGFEEIGQILNDTDAVPKGVDLLRYINKQEPYTVPMNSMEDM